MRDTPDLAEVTCYIFLAAGILMWSGARAAPWQLVDSSSRAQVEVDLATVSRKDGAATGWVQHTYARQTSSQSGAYFAYRSMKEQLRANCNDRNLAVLARVYLNDEGNEIAMIKGKGETRPVAPDSIDHRVLTRLCNPPVVVQAAANSAARPLPPADVPHSADGRSRSTEGRPPTTAGRYMDAPARPVAAVSGFVKASLDAAPHTTPGGPMVPAPTHAAALANRSPESRKEVVQRVLRQRGVPHESAAAESSTPRAAPALKPAQIHAQTPAHDAHWGYEGENAPYRWGEMKSDFALCKSGSRQSPIDIRNPVVSEVEPIQFRYEDMPLKVSNNGHTIQVDTAPGSFILHGGQRYELMQFHFHTPSEERINGRSFEMVAHLVHKNAQGRLAVVAVLLTAGKEQPMLQQVWNAMPGSANRTRERQDVMINAAQLLPADPAYYSFMGSLTTPPCTEGVQWLVMKTPVEISRDQISHFAALYPMNARPLQASNDRLIKAGK
jgi:carbonic anhydrase